MITTSAPLSRLAMSRPRLPRRLREGVVVVRRLVVRLELALLEALLVGGGDHRAHARIADEIPADEVRVAAVVRIAERALMRVVEHKREERGGAAGEPGSGTGLDVDQHRILIDRRQLGERLPARRTPIP